MIFVYVETSLRVANYPGLAHEAIHRSGKDVPGWGVTDMVSEHQADCRLP